jgi:uncharacterized protein with LGFP repeats
VATAADPTPIAVKYAATGGAGGPLGAATGAETCDLMNLGCRQTFQNGEIYWHPRSTFSPGTPASVLSGAIRTRFDALVARSSMYYPGYPTGDALCGLRGGGCGQFFLNDEFRSPSAIYWSPSTGAHDVTGGILEVWRSTGWERGYLGYPITDNDCTLAWYGCFQVFQGGSVYESPDDTGNYALTYVVRGAIRDRWATTGWERGPLGYPRSGENCGLAGSGCYQLFQGGSMYWSPVSGAQPVGGAIRDRWAATGWERGFLGYPVSGENCGLAGGGCYQLFQGGSMYWSPASGAQHVGGAIRTAWAAQGWERGRLGYPLTGEYPVPGGVAQRFQGGTLTFAFSTGRAR